MNYINSCSLAYLSNFLTMTSILSKETRKERDLKYICNPFLVSVWIQKDLLLPATGLLSLRGQQTWTPSGHQPELCCPAPAGRYSAQGSTHFWLSWLCAGALGNAPLKIAPPWSFTYIVFVVLFSKHYMEKCLCFITCHIRGFCCRGLPSFPELQTMYSRPDLKT